MIDKTHKIIFIILCLLRLAFRACSEQAGRSHGPVWRHCWRWAHVCQLRAVCSEKGGISSIMGSEYIVGYGEKGAERGPCAIERDRSEEVKAVKNRLV